MLLKILLAGWLSSFIGAEAYAAAGADAEPFGAEGISIELPAVRRPLPEPLPPGAKPGFAIRGIKGLAWTPKQYLEEIPVLAKYKMNFLMVCYLSLFSGFSDDETEWSLPTPERGLRNEWWQPLADARKAAYAEVIRSCREQGIDFCFSMNPQFHSPRPLDPASDDDFEKLWQHYAWAQGQGVKWFSLCLDDVDAHVEAFPMVEKLFQRLRSHDAECHFIFCPSYYWGNATHPAERRYLEILATQLHPDIYLFWTGMEGISREIGRKEAEAYKNASQHRLIVWDNYPWNGSDATVHLGPLTCRDPDLCEVADGYMANPLCPDNQAGRLPLLTMADFAYNPRAYDPARSIGQAVFHLAETDEQRLALKDLVEAYPGWIIAGGNASTNAARRRFERLLKSPERRLEAIVFARRHAGLAARMDQLFPNQFESTKRIIHKDADWMISILLDDLDSGRKVTVGLSAL